MNTSQKSINLALAYLLVVATFIVYFVGVAFLSLAFPDLGINQLSESRLQSMIEENPLKFFFLAVIFAPVIEEGLWRTLIKPKSWELSLFVSSWIVFIGLSFIPQDVYWWLTYAIAGLTLYLLHKIFSELLVDKNTAKIRALLSKYYIATILISSIIFGFMHVGNYVDTFTVTIPIFIAIIPRIILGIYFSAIKIVNGHIFWAISLHAINNAAVFLITYVTLNNEAFNKTLSVVVSQLL